MPHDLKALTHRWFEEVWNKGNAAAIDEMIVPAVVGHGLSEKALAGKAGFETFYKMYRGAFSNIRVTLTHCLADNDSTACRFTFQAKHTGDTLGFPPTGKDVTITAICMFRWQNSRIAEAFNEFDQLGLLRQLQQDARRVTP